MKRFKVIGLVFVLALVCSIALLAEDAKALLNQGIVAMETVGDLTQAIDLFTKIVADEEKTKADPETAADAWFRLGECYRKEERFKEAKAAYSELRKRYPEREDLISRIPTDFDLEGPLFRPAPWEDGEVLQYIGEGIWDYKQIKVTESFEDKSVTGWKVRNIFMINQMQIVHDDVIRMDSKFTTLDEHQNNIGDGEEVHLNFNTDHIEIQVNNRPKTNLLHEQTVFADDSKDDLYRCLLLEKDFETNLTFAERLHNYGGVPQNNWILFKSDIKVVDRKTIAVPAGIFDCYIIEPTIGGWQSTKRRYWVSAERPFYIVQLEEENTAHHRSNFTKLTSISKIKKNQPVVFNDTVSGLSFTAPSGWIVASFDELNTDRMSIIDPEGKSQCFLEIRRQAGNNDPGKTLTLTVDQMIIENKLLPFPDKVYLRNRSYKIREGTREMKENAGATITSFIADTVKNALNQPGQGMNATVFAPYTQYEYIYYFEDAGKICRLHFETRPDDFDAMKPSFDSIAKSVQMQ